jgi:hypothetical protein
MISHSAIKPKGKRAVMITSRSDLNPLSFRDEAEMIILEECSNEVEREGLPSMMLEEYENDQIMKRMCHEGCANHAHSPNVRELCITTFRVKRVKDRVKSAREV